MCARVTFVEQDGQKYGYLESVDETQTLSHIRASASKFLTGETLPEKYVFTWKKAPISPQQEEIIKLSRCSEVVSQQPRILKLYIIDKNNGNCSSHVNTVTYTGQSKAESLSNNGKVDEHTLMRSGLKLFDKNEIEDPKIATIEKERRIFWNSLVNSICSQKQFKGWSLQALNGLIDTEWTLRKTELLQLDADQAIDKINSTQKATSHKTDVREKKIQQILDRLLLLDFQRKKVYKKIEDLHEQLKHSATAHTKVQDQIALEEDNLDKVFTELKSCQSSLQQSIANSSKTIEYSAEVAGSATLVKESPAILSDDELEDIRQSVVDDYAVDSQSDSN